MSDSERFDFYRHRLQRFFNDSPNDHDFEILLAAFAFQLSGALSAMPDDFWVTPVADIANVTDVECDQENAWSNALDKLFRCYVDRRAK